MPEVTLQVHGLDCAEEVALLRAEFAPLKGIHELSFDVLRGRMTVTYDESLTNLPGLIDAVGRAGLKAVEYSGDVDTHNLRQTFGRTWRLICTASSGLLVLAGLAVQFQGPRGIIATGVAAPMIVRAMYFVAAGLGLWFAIPKAVFAVRRMRPDMNLLMVIASIGAFSIGEDAEGASVAFLFSLSLTLESWSVDRARRAIESLMALAPSVGCRLSPHHQEGDRREEIVPAAEISVGTTILVRPGERFPLDGEIVKGETTVNQAPITGESIPVPKLSGSNVLAGSINETGTVEVVTTKLASDSILARILKLVTDAQRKRSSSEQWVETFAHYYTPTVLIVAIAVMIVPPLLVHGAWSHWFYEGLVLLVIACPCALVISTPVSIVAALSSAAKQGVLVKGGRFLEMAARLRAVAFDKTGTLTSGKLEVQKVVPQSGHTEKELLEIASAIESQSRHPLAEAIVRHATAIGLKPAPATNFQSRSGIGATAMLNGQPVWIGSPVRLMEFTNDEFTCPESHGCCKSASKTGERDSCRIPHESENHIPRQAAEHSNHESRHSSKFILPDVATLDGLEESSLVAVGNDEHVCGVIALGDSVRPNAAASVSTLRHLGVTRVVLLTGDNFAAGFAVGSAAGIDDVRAELLPEDKVNVVSELVRDHGFVAMVGDGVNDAPAMARASLGIAMGHVGTDAALETADVVLMNDDLSKIPWMIGHARRMVQVIRQNITASLLVKAAFAVLTIVGAASLWSAIAADTGISLVVVLNALRLLNPKEKSSSTEFQAQAEIPHRTDLKTG